MGNGVVAAAPSPGWLQVSSAPASGLPGGALCSSQHLWLPCIAPRLLPTFSETPSSLGSVCLGSTWAHPTETAQILPPLMGHTQANDKWHPRWVHSQGFKSFLPRVWEGISLFYKYFIKCFLNQIRDDVRKAPEKLRSKSRPENSQENSHLHSLNVLTKRKHYIHPPLCSWSVLRSVAQAEKKQKLEMNTPFHRWVFS